MSTIILLNVFAFLACASYMGFVMARERRRMSGPVLLPGYVTTRKSSRRYA
jgi:hypothetical protein